MSGTQSISALYACDIAKPLTGYVAAGLIALFAVLTGSEPASALSKEQAIENCRQTVGAPIVRACMQGMGKGGDREANLATCRAGVLPKMKACVMAALNAANGRANVAIEIYKNGKPKDRRGGSRQCAPGRLRRSAAHDRRYHRNSGQRKARPCDARQVEGQCRQRTGKEHITGRPCAILHRPRYCPFRARPQHGSAGGRREGAGGGACVRGRIFRPAHPGSSSLFRSWRWAISRARCRYPSS